MNTDPLADQWKTAWIGITNGYFQVLVIQWKTHFFQRSPHRSGPWIPQFSRGIVPIQGKDLVFLDTMGGPSLSSWIAEYVEEEDASWAQRK